MKYGHACNSVWHLIFYFKKGGSGCALQIKVAMDLENTFEFESSSMVIFNCQCNEYSLFYCADPSYTETIKLCLLDVYVCQFQMHERISVKLLHYQL